MKKNGILSLTTLTALFIQLVGISPVKAQDSYVMVCRGSGGMETRVQDNTIRIWFSRAYHSATSREVGNGECAWMDRAIGQKEPSMLYYSGARQDINRLRNAVRSGGKFFVRAYNNGNGAFVVTRPGP